MRRLWGLSFILLLLFSSACQEQAPAPSPMPPSPAATIPGLPVQSQAVSLATLLRNPGAFLNNVVQVSGQYRAQPLLVCPEVTNRSPATWSLTAGDLEIGAGGLDSLLRGLAPEGLSLVVEGRWRRWTGPVGCGRRPPEQSIWYLEVLRIVSPNPLAARGSVSEATESVLTPQPTATTEPLVTVIATMIPPPTEATEPADATPTPTGTIAPTATAESATATVGPTATGTSSVVTATPSATPTATLTPSPSPESEPSVTATPQSTGVLSFELNGNLVKRSLQVGQAHQWQFAGSPDTVTTISVAGSSELDVTLTLVGPNQQELAEEDNQTAGGIETINQFTLTQSGTYLIRVRANGDTSGSYALVLLNTFSEPFYVHQGNLNYNGSGSGSVPESVDHLYHFVGQAGDRISVNATSDSNTDLVLYLLGTQGTELIFVDDTAVGMAESISSFQLPSDGYYSIGVGDADFEAASYTVTLTRDS
ncbi:MAG: hypothetical protein R3300_02310 [Candidatus Promineifilaceae bacterium]|nr:hypothetical protein [Candidatus Promineifilaceae bacterium]